MVDASVKAVVIADTPEEIQPFEACLTELGLQPERILGLSFLPPGELPYDLIVFAGGTDRRALKGLLSQVKADAQLVALVPPDTDLATTAFLVADPRCNHVLQTDERGRHRVRTTAAKVMSGDIFGLDKYLPDVDIEYVRLRTYRERSDAIDRIISYAEEHKVRRQLRQSIAQVCEELLMNALYNAPVDDFGRPLFAHVSPKDRLELETPRPVSIRFASSDSLFGVAVRDRFGTLRKDTVLRYIHKCLHSQQQIDGKAIGAGLGLYLVASRASEYVLNIAPGLATEAIAVFGKRGGIRRAPGTFSIFTHPGPPEDGDRGEP